MHLNKESKHMKQAFIRGIAVAFLSLFIFLSSSVASTPSDWLPERDRAIELAITVNDILTSYIEVHNDVFKVSGRRIVPIPGYFEAINFKQHVETLENLCAKLGQIDQDITRWIGNGVKNPEARDFLIALRSYSKALSDAIKKFESISRQLYKKSQDPDSYVWKSYSKDLEKYEKAIERYRLLGQSLNESYKRLNK